MRRRGGARPPRRRLDLAHRRRGGPGLTRIGPYAFRRAGCRAPRARRRGVGTERLTAASYLVRGQECACSAEPGGLPCRGRPRGPARVYGRRGRAGHAARFDAHRHSHDSDSDRDADADSRGSPDSDRDPRLPRRRPRPRLLRLQPRRRGVADSDAHACPVPGDLDARPLARRGHRASAGRVRAPHVRARRAHRMAERSAVHGSGDRAGRGLPHRREMGRGRGGGVARRYPRRVELPGARAVESLGHRRGVARGGEPAARPRTRARLAPRTRAAAVGRVARRRPPVGRLGPCHAHRRGAHGGARGSSGWEGVRCSPPMVAGWCGAGTRRSTSQTCGRSRARCCSRPRRTSAGALPVCHTRLRGRARRSWSHCGTAHRRRRTTGCDCGNGCAWAGAARRDPASPPMSRCHGSPTRRTAATSRGRTAVTSSTPWTADSSGPASSWPMRARGTCSSVCVRRRCS